MSFLSSSGVSSASKQLTECVWQLRNHVSDTISFGWREILIQDLIEVQSRCNESDWDGYGAVPITKQTMLAAVTLLRFLPDYMMATPPDIVPEPTGEIGFSWVKNADMHLVVAVSKESIAFAQLIGSKKLHGEMKFLSDFPTDVGKTVLEYFINS